MMRLLRGVGTAFAVLLLVLMASCGGSSTALNAPPADLDQQAVPVVATEGDLPSIPLDRVASDEGNPMPPGENWVVVWGKDYIQQHASTVVGDYLELGTGEVTNERMPAFGMYKVRDLQELRPLSLNVECIPEYGDTYWVAVADYTIGAWVWHGPIEIPEFELDLSASNHRYVTNLGNMYFLITTELGMVAMHEKTTVICEVASGGDPGLPGRPFDLEASDGASPDGVGVHWTPGGGQHYFEVWRAPVNFGGYPPAGGDPGEGSWEHIADAQAPEFFDASAPPGVHFLYKVRAVNPAGMSEFSNIDEGWAAETGPPPGGTIAGQVFAPGFGGPAPLANAHIYLVSANGIQDAMTNEAGHFVFNELPPGFYSVIAHHSAYMFEPNQAVVHLEPGMSATVEFQGFVPENKFFSWGYVFQQGSPDPGTPGFGHLAGVPVNLNIQGAPPAYEAETNAHGFFMIGDMEAGIYLVTPSSPYYSFEPPVSTVNVNYAYVSPPQIFIGHLDNGGGDPPPHSGSISGYVLRPGEEGPLANAHIYLVSANGIQEATTNVYGHFYFAELPPGFYSVIAHQVLYMFQPHQNVVHLEPGMSATVEFQGFVPENKFFAWGFVFQQGSSDPGAPGFGHLAGVPVTASIAGAEPSYEAATDQHGMFIMSDMDTGYYQIEPHSPYYTFDPAVSTVSIYPYYVTPPQIFIGHLNNGGDPYP